MTSLSAYMSYQGFDPILLGIKLDRMVKSEANRKFDIALMIAIFIERGDEVSKMHLESTPLFKKIIAELIATYDLKDKPSKDPTVITLSRVASTFPHIACAYMEVAINPPISTTDLLKHVCEDYPKVMMCPHFTALIPRDHLITKNLLCAHGVFNYYFTLKIADKKLIQQETSAIVQNVWIYMNIIHQGSYFDLDSQIFYLQSMGIISSANNEIKCVSAVQVAADYWNENFGKFLPEDDDDVTSDDEGRPRTSSGSRNDGQPGPEKNKSQDKNKKKKWNMSYLYNLWKETMLDD